MRRGSGKTRSAVTYRLARLALLAGMLGWVTANGQVPARPDTIRVDTLDRVGLEKTIALCWDVLKRYPDSEFAPTLMFQLMQLYVRSAELDFAVEMDKYEQEIKRFDRGERADEPKMPTIDLSKAIDVGETLLRTFPNISFKAKVLYSLALCYDKEERKNEYIKALQRLVTECPEDPLVPETYFRIGEHYFDRREYSRAIEAYSKLLDFWESPYFDMALYKLAWSYFNQGDYAHAISSFVYLIDDLDTVERSNPELMGRSKIDLRQEALQYIAISFSEYGGVEKAKEFLASIGPRSWSAEIFLRLGRVYFARNEYGEATRSFRTFLSLFPDDPRAIDAYVEVVRCQEAAGDFVNADRARKDLLQTFNPASAWYQSLDPFQRAHADSVLRKTYLALGTNYTVAARDAKDATLYQQAVGVYKEYLRFYPNGAESNRVRFLLAETFYESGQLRLAAEAYEECFDVSADSQYAEKAGFNRIYCWDQLRERAPTFDSTDVTLYEFFGDSVRVIRTPNSETAELLRACHEFLRAFPTSEKWPVIMLKLGATLFDLGEYELAERVYQELLSREVPVDARAKAMAMIGQCRFRLGDFDGTEQWFDRLSTAFPDSEELQLTAARMKASSRYKRALELKEKGDTEKAAELFAAAAEISPDDQLAAVSLFEAGTQYEKAGKAQQAIEQYDLLCARFPSSQFADESLYRASLLRESLGDWQEAARGYLRLANDYPDSRYARHALFLAGCCFENDSSLTDALTIFEEYTRRFGEEDPDEYLEAMVHSGEIQKRMGLRREAERTLRAAVDAYVRLKMNVVPVDDYIAARAQFLLGELAFEDYTAVKIEPPLDRSLAAKREAFTKVLKAYTETARYRVAEWTSAATCRIGEAFEEFARALWESPIPPELTPEERELYVKKLAEQVKPFKEKAYEAYRRNVKLSEQTGLVNDWIARSKERAQELAIELNLPAQSAPVPADTSLAQKHSITGGAEP